VSVAKSELDSLVGRKGEIDSELTRRRADLTSLREEFAPSRVLTGIEAEIKRLENERAGIDGRIATARGV